METILVYLVSYASKTLTIVPFAYDVILLSVRGSFFDQSCDFLRP